MLLPSALATGSITPSNLRAAGLLPFIYLFPALALTSIQHRASSIQHRVSSTIVSLFILALFIALLLATTRAYFHEWSPSAGLYQAADGDLADVAAALAETDLEAVTPYVASIHYRHPTLAFLMNGPGYERIRWLTGGETVVFPAAGEAFLFFPRSAAQELAWAASVLPEGALVAAPPGPDGEPAYHAYRTGPVEPAPAIPLPGGPADLAHVVQVAGHDALGEAHGGGSARVAVWLRVLNPPPGGDYGPVARLVDAWGSTWGESQPFHYPSEQWTPGEVIVDHLAVPVAPGAPPGEYTVRFGLYSPSADHRLPVLGEAGAYSGTYVELPVQVARAAVPPHPDELGVGKRLDVPFDGVTLLGADLHTPSARPGERVYLTLYWRAGDGPPPGRDVTLTADGVTLYAGAPVHGAYPFSAWQAGEVVADRYDPRLPREMAPGDHPLVLRLGDGEVTLGSVSVQGLDRAFDVPPLSHPISATLGSRVELLGYDLSPETGAPGRTLTLTLAWRALAEMEESYTIFAHLAAPDGSVAAQRDGLPAGGAYPTDLWLAGEVVTDVREIAIPAGAAPGPYTLAVGMYLAGSGERLAMGDGDAVVLQSVNVVQP